MYNLENDPYELSNLIGNGNYKVFLNESREKLKNWMEEKGDDILKAFENMHLS